MEFVNYSFCQAFFLMLYIFLMFSVHYNELLHSLVRLVDDAHLDTKDLERQKCSIPSVYGQAGTNLSFFADF